METQLLRDPHFYPDEDVLKSALHNSFDALEELMAILSYEKNASGVQLLEIDEQIKKFFNNSRPIGKLIPLVVNVESKEQINDLLTIIGYKLKT